MPYQITQEIRAKAKAIGVTVKPSTRKGKKLDAYVDGQFQASFGATGYKDYELYKKEKGKEYTDEKRKAYKARHEKDRKVKYRDGRLTAGFLADRILW